MPSAPPRICARCRQPTPKNQRCPCRPAFEGATRRKAGTRWRTLRAHKLHTTPTCEHPGCPRLADEVDHITPLAEGGDEFKWSNLQSLCHAHHREKTTTDALHGKRRLR